jgi:hypothetical protein
MFINIAYEPKKQIRLKRFRNVHRLIASLQYRALLNQLCFIFTFKNIHIN